MAPLTQFFAFALAMLVASEAARAQDSPVTEESVKAAFLYKFPGFVEWPGNALARMEDTVVIGVAGSDEVYNELASISDTRRSGRPLIVKRVREGSSLAGLHILFVGRGDRARAPELLRAAQSQGVLTVTDWDGALRVGSMINFVTTPEGRVRFEVFLEPAERGNLRLSSRLLAVAQQVHTTRP